jgi:hypothetical protein
LTTTMVTSSWKPTSLQKFAALLIKDIGREMFRRG